MKCIVRVPERIKIAAKPIIIYRAETVNQQVAVSDETSADEKIGLLFKR